MISATKRCRLPRMYVLLFDTETNGLPRMRNALTSDVNNWPRIVQIAWQLWVFSDAGSPRLVERDSYIVKPDEELSWNQESAAIHGISKERALAEGSPCGEAFAAFTRVAAKATVLVAHNMAFDKPVLKAEYLRLNRAEGFGWWPPHEYCTCENTKVLCKLPSKFAKTWDPYKLPKLTELYSFLHGDIAASFEWHNAIGDVECLVSCFQELARRRVLPLDVWFRDALLRDKLLDDSE
jgi:DNA polymerase-3 subunit epsilon